MKKMFKIISLLVFVVIFGSCNDDVKSRKFLDLLNKVDFPTNAHDNQTYVDSYGNVWVYSSFYEKWVKKEPGGYSLSSSNSNKSSVSSSTNLRSSSNSKSGLFSSNKNSSKSESKSSTSSSINLKKKSSSNSFSLRKSSSKSKSSFSLRKRH